MHNNNRSNGAPIAKAAESQHLLQLLTRLLVMLVLCAMLSACGGDPSGMQRPIDGSSVSAFEATEQTLRSELTADQFSQYNRSVNYLQLKAFDAPTIADFYLTLDGKTPEQLIEQAEAARSGN